MTHQQIIDYCLQKPCTYADFPFGPEITVLKLKAPSQEKGRIFTQVFMLHGHEAVTVNCTPASAVFFREIYQGAVTRGWHCPPVLQPHFNTVMLDGRVPDGEIFSMIDHAYEVVSAKLPKYLQRELQEAAGVF